MKTYIRLFLFSLLSKKIHFSGLYFFRNRMYSEQPNINPSFDAGDSTLPMSHFTNSDRIFPATSHTLSLPSENVQNADRVTRFQNLQYRYTVPCDISTHRLAFKHIHVQAYIIRNTCFFAFPPNKAFYKISRMTLKQFPSKYENSKQVKQNNQIKSTV